MQYSTAPYTTVQYRTGLRTSHRNERAIGPNYDLAFLISSQSKCPIVAVWRPLPVAPDIATTTITSAHAYDARMYASGTMRNATKVFSTVRKVFNLKTMPKNMTWFDIQL